MLTMSFWQDALERALKSLAQAIVLAVGADHVFNLLNANLLDLAGIGAGGFVLSILTSIGTAALPVGTTGTASLTTAVEPTTEPTTAGKHEA